MIDYSVYCQIREYYYKKNLSVSQIAKELNLSKNTVKERIKQNSYTQRKKTKRQSKLDPYKGKIVRLLNTHPYSVVQIFNDIKQDGYDGGMSILKEFIKVVRPKEHKAYLTLNFKPGECAQIDWGEYKTVRVGASRNKLSFFVMVLCYSRMLYVEFAYKQTMEHFLSCQKNAFEYFGGVPRKIVCDNLSTAIVSHKKGHQPVINSRYLDFSRHYGFEIRACNVASPNEKGRVENGVGYVKKNFLNGIDIEEFGPLNPAARIWMETVCNVRLHGTTREKPTELLVKEKSKLLPLSPMPYDIGVTRAVRASNQFRVVLDTNKYSVPYRYASRNLTMRVYPERVIVYDKDRMIAEHPRCYDQHKDFENPDHVRPLLEKKRQAKKSKIMEQFMRISKLSEEYYRQLERKSLNAEHHIRKIVALSEIYGAEKVALVLEDALKLGAYSSVYISNILEIKSRKQLKPHALHVTHKEDLLDLETQKADLSVYKHIK